MDPIAGERLFGFRQAFDSPVTLWITIAVIAALLIASVIIWLLQSRGRTSDKLHDELVKRVVSWAVMTPLLLGPVLLGAAWTILAVAILSVLCYREFARATGFFRYRSLSIVVVLGMIATPSRSRIIGTDSLSRYHHSPLSCWRWSRFCAMNRVVISSELALGSLVFCCSAIASVILVT